jgi:tetratricopeptide (TPR) repeat protein
VAYFLNNQALLYFSIGKYTEAELLYQRTLHIWEKSLGPDHPDIATCLENYATLLKKMNREPEAQPMEVRAASIKAKRAEKNPKN